MAAEIDGRIDIPSILENASIAAAAFCALTEIQKSSERDADPRKGICQRCIGETTPKGPYPVAILFVVNDRNACSVDERKLLSNLLQFSRCPTRKLTSCVSSSNNRFRGAAKSI
jgi:hypothetical protein